METAGLAAGIAKPSVIFLYRVTKGSAFEDIRDAQDKKQAHPKSL